MSLADLKAHMGHDSVRAAMIYQHAAAEADQKIANALDDRIGTAQIKLGAGSSPRGTSRPDMYRTGTIEEHDPKHSDGQ